MVQARIRRTTPRLSRPPDFRGLEDVYAARLLMVLNAVWVSIRGALPHLLPDEERVDSLHQDAAIPSVVVAMFDQLRVGIYQILRPATSRAAQQTGVHVYQKGRPHAQNVVKQVLRINLPEQEPWIGALMDNWVTENVALIRSVGEESLADVEQTLLRMIREGKSRKETEEELEKRFGLSRARARVIARDQVNKLNGQITKARQTNLGLKTYEWNTANDRRVRGNPAGHYPDSNPSHWLMEGMLCKWDDPTVYSDDGGKKWKKRIGRMPKAHPGEEIQCRCFGQPSLAEMGVE